MSLLLDALKSAEKKRLDTESGLSTEADPLPLVGDPDDTKRHKLISEKGSNLSLEANDENSSIKNSYVPNYAELEDSNHNQKDNEIASNLSLESNDESHHIELEGSNLNQKDVELKNDNYEQANVSHSIGDHPSTERNNDNATLADNKQETEFNIELKNESVSSTVIERSSPQIKEPTNSTDNTVTDTHVNTGDDDGGSPNIKDFTSESATNLDKNQADVATEPELPNNKPEKKVLTDIGSPESAAEIFIAKLPKPKPSYYNKKYLIILLLVLSSVTISGYFIYELSIKPLNNKSDFRELLNSNVAIEKTNTDISQTNDSGSILDTDEFSHDNSSVEPPLAANPSLQNEEINTTTNIDETFVTEKDRNITAPSDNSAGLQKESITATQETSVDTKNSAFQGAENEEKKISPETTNNSLPDTSKSSENINTNVAQIDPPSNNNVIDHGNGIVITRNLKTDDKKNLLASAYRMYEERNYNAAKNQYAEILQTQPNNYDALLGFATTTQALGENKLAEQYYNILINRYPSDTYAQAGLLSLLDSFDFSARTSKIKSFIKSSPNTAYFHFLLGENYAKNHLWGDAQAALFDAVRLDKDNPDYNFNLAVSLDQINKHDVALNYYQDAISLASTRPANFDLNQARTRASQLQELRN